MGATMIKQKQEFLNEQINAQSNAQKAIADLSAFYEGIEGQHDKVRGKYAHAKYPRSKFQTQKDVPFRAYEKFRSTF